MFVNGSGRNEFFSQRTFHRCFLPSFSSFGWEVSEEKIKMWKLTDDGRQTTDDGRRTPSDAKSSHCLWQGDLKRQKDKQRSTKHTLNLSIEKKYQCSCIPFGGTRVYIRFLWGSCCSIFNFLSIVLWIIVFLFVSFLLAIILSVPLWLTASDYTPPLQSR